MCLCKGGDAMFHQDFPSNGKLPRRKKNLTEEIVRIGFFEGFMEGVSDGDRDPRLEYGSASGTLCSYNGVRRISHQYGYDFAKAVMKHREGKLIALTPEYKIPTECWSACYSEMRIGA
jgi:hypothetical protein